MFEVLQEQSNFPVAKDYETRATENYTAFFEYAAIHRLRLSVVSLKNQHPK